MLARKSELGDVAMVPARLYPRRSVTHLVVHQSDREDISLTYGGVWAWHVTPAKKIGSFFRVLVCEYRRAAELLYPRAKPYVRPASCCLLHEAMYPPARSTSVCCMYKLWYILRSYCNCLLSNVVWCGVRLQQYYCYCCRPVPAC